MSWLRSGYGGEKTIAFLSTVLLVGQSEGFQAPDAAMRLTNEDLHFLFGDQEAPPHSLVNIRSKSREKRSTPFLTENPGLLEVTLEDEGQEVEFELRLNHEVVSPDFLLVVRDTDGVTEERGLGHPSCLYYGTAKGKPDTTAALSNCDGHGFTGVIVSGNQSHLLRPLNHRRRRRQSDLGDDLTPEGLHVIHTRREGAKCGVFDIKAMTAPRYLIELPTTEEPNGHSITKRAIDSKGQIETAVFVDDDMYNVIKKANPNKNVEETVKDVVFAIMNGVHMLYNAPSLDKHFTITLVRVDIIKNSTKGPSKAGGDIHKYLGTFCVWQKNLNRKAKVGEAWDHALMLSGLDLFDGSPQFDTVIGLAWVSGMCHPSYSCTINEGTSFEAVYVIAHEMGHNLGMAHDGEDSGNRCDSEKFLMSASTGPGKVTWSDCSNKELKTFLSKVGTTCLVNRGRGPRLLEFEDDDLPGVKYTQEKQCSFGEGSNFKPYVTSKHPYNSVCRELWCQNTTHALRIHPALEGTTCGLKKLCVNGQCVLKKSHATTTQSPPANPSIQTNNAEDKETSSGLSNLLRRIRDLFRRYLSLRSEVPATVFASRWRLTQVTPCTAECGGGWQERRVTCMGAGGKKLLSDDLCDTQLRPPSKTACNYFPCITSTRVQGFTFPDD